MDENQKDIMEKSPVGQYIEELYRTLHSLKWERDTGELER